MTKPELCCVGCTRRAKKVEQHEHGDWTQHRNMYPSTIGSNPTHLCILFLDYCLHIALGLPSVCVLFTNVLLVMGPVHTSAKPTPWGAYSPRCHDSAVHSQRQPIGAQLSIHLLLDGASAHTGEVLCPRTHCECTHRWSALPKDTLPHHRNWCPHLRPLSPKWWVIATVPWCPACMCSIYSDIGTLRVVSARSLSSSVALLHTPLNISETAQPFIWSWELRQRYAVFNVEGQEMSPQASPAMGFKPWLPAWLTCIKAQCYCSLLKCVLMALVQRLEPMVEQYSYSCGAQCQMADLPDTFKLPSPHGK